MSFKTPLGSVRGLGSAKSGSEHFWRQRLTSVANVPLVILFVIIVISSLGKGYGEVASLIGSPLVAIIFLALIISAVYHMYLGMQVIIEDYVHGEGVKIAAIIVNTFFSAVIGIAAVFAILKLSFGG